MSTPLVTVFVRHAKDCKYSGDEFCRRCRCRKHLRWTQNGTQYRRKAGTRSWEEAENEKRLRSHRKKGFNTEITEDTENSRDLFLQLREEVEGIERLQLVEVGSAELVEDGAIKRREENLLMTVATRAFA